MQFPIWLLSTTSPGLTSFVLHNSYCIISSSKPPWKPFRIPEHSSFSVRKQRAAESYYGSGWAWIFRGSWSPYLEEENCRVEELDSADPGREGQGTILDVDKYAIMRRVRIHARDLRILDPLLSYPSKILGREKVIVLNLEVNFFIAFEFLLLGFWLADHLIVWLILVVVGFLVAAH